MKQLIALIDTQPDNLKECLDVIYKWCYIKLTESQNTTLYVSVFDGIQTIFDWLEKDSTQLMEHEAYILIPLLCDKVGNNNKILQTKIKALLKQTYNLYDDKKTVQLIIKFGTNGKNLKSVADCLEALASYLTEKGIDVLTDKDLKHFAKLADNNDKGVREGALQVLGEVYKVMDEDIWRLIG